MRKPHSKWKVLLLWDYDGSGEIDYKDFPRVCFQSLIERRN